MMNRPPVSELAEKAGSRYLLVTSVSARARQLQNNPEALGNRKALSVAVEEMYEGKLTVTPNREA
ncbi:MAG: DNA-directed RNA polymerase subunit omega [Clostridia bacterium]|nr:DNA-directed RNA polymerase subunit omega [Clostridia bacterium]